jgi:hypothetical protein
LHSVAFVRVQALSAGFLPWTDGPRHELVYLVESCLSRLYHPEEEIESTHCLIFLCLKTKPRSRSYPE